MLHKFSTWILFASSLPVNSCSCLSLLTFSFSSLFTYKQIGLIQSATKTERYDQKILMLSNTWKRLEKKSLKQISFWMRRQWPRHFLRDFPPRKSAGCTNASQDFPPRKCNIRPPTPNWLTPDSLSSLQRVTGGRTLTSQPKFLGCM